MDSYKFEVICKNAIIDYYKKYIKFGMTGFKLSIKDVYVVWSCKTLENNKALLSTTRCDGFYFECTYNGAKDELYLDLYVKSDNKCISQREFICEVIDE